jgi:threonylcarbamoyladenosine tRNA methylthiotransferase MtaB
MGRPATVASYWGLMDNLIREVPGICLGADIIVGFPGETERHFLRTYDFLTQAPLAYLHVFPFSPRPGTPAASLPHAPSAAVKKERVQLLRSLAREKSFRFRSSFIGCSLEALVLSPPHPTAPSYTALSDNYLPLLIEGGGKELVGQLVRVEIQGFKEGILSARWKE